MKTPYFSIITVSFNSENTIEKTITSVLAQTFQDYEYLIIDGGSNDSTLDIIEKFKTKFKDRMRYISEPDNGIFDAMNKGVMMSSGIYISILNSDDYYDEKTLQIVYERTKDNNTKIINGDILRVDEKGDAMFRYYFSQLRVERKIPFGHPAMFVPKSAYNIVGLYNIDLDMCADTDFHYRLYETYDKKYFEVVEEVLTYMREGGISDRKENLKRSIQQKIPLEIKYKNRSYIGAFIHCAWFETAFYLRKRFPIRFQHFVYKYWHKLKLR